MGHRNEKNNRDARIDDFLVNVSKGKTPTRDGRSVRALGNLHTYHMPGSNKK